MRTCMLSLVLCSFAVSAAAEVSGEAGAFIGNRYVWRGITLTDGPVLQPSVSASAYGVSFGVWANTELDDANGLAGETSEVDLTLAYEFTGGPVAMTVGAVAYLLPATSDPTTTEIFLGASLPDLPFSPGLTIYRDVQEVKSLYATLSVGHGISIAGTNIDLALALGLGDGDYFEGYLGTSASGVADLAVSAGSTFSLAENLSLTVGVQFTSLLRDAVRETAESAGMKPDAVILGVSATYSF